MKTKYVFVIFIIIAIAQIAVPAQMILKREDVLNTGKLYKFKTKPIDPADPFRGKYIALNFDADSYKTYETSWTRDETIYVYLDEDSLGYAKIDRVSKQIEQDVDKDYFKAKVGRYATKSKRLHIKLPFNRFYMEESKAYPAEVAVRETQRNIELNDVYAMVYVKNGTSVLKDVIINHMPIKDYVEKEVKSH